MALVANTIYNEDCLDGMKKIESATIDMILCDLPYGTTACAWDAVIPFESLWKHYKRIIKPNHPIVLFATQPFTSLLIASNLPMFKYTWVWEKSRPGGHVNAKLKPLKSHEDICVFTDGPIANGASIKSPYFPQGLTPGGRVKKRASTQSKGTEGIRFWRESHPEEWTVEWTNYPRDVIRYPNPNSNLIHPTQKPIDLLEYLIKTYTSKGAVVLDNCMGSGATAIACMNIGRKFLGFELEEKYFVASLERIASERDKLADCFVDES